MNKFILLLGLIASNAVSAATAGMVRVFDIRRQVSLSNDKQNPRDIYLSAGYSHGLKVGAVYTIHRRQPVYDQTNTVKEDLVLPVSKVRVLWVQAHVSLARALPDQGRVAETLKSALDESVVMVGDFIDLTRAGVDTAGNGANGFDDQDQSSDKSGGTSGAALVTNPFVGSPDPAVPESSDNKSTAVTKAPVARAPVAKGFDSPPKIEVEVLGTKAENSLSSGSAGSLFEDKENPSIPTR